MASERGTRQPPSQARPAAPNPPTRQPRPARPTQATQTTRRQPQQAQPPRRPTQPPRPPAQPPRRPARPIPPPVNRKRRQHHLLRNLILALLVLVLTGGVIYFFTGDFQLPASGNALTKVESTAPVAVATEPNTVIHITAAGDLNVTDSVLQHNQLADASYDFRSAFLDMVPILAKADLAVLNLEGNLCGEPYNSETGSAPIALAQALAEAGVDLVQTANSFSIRNGMLGLADTLDSLHAAGLETVGAYATSQEARSGKGFLIREIQGLRIAFVAFTKGMDNLSLPEGSENCVNLLYTDYATTYHDVDYAGIRRILRNVADAQPDFTIALLHWGSEYNDEISDTQKSIRNVMFENGVDAIIGTHPHLVQEIDYDESAGTLVAYSLGDFYGDATEGGSNYSILLDLEITRDNNTGMTSLTNYTCTPIYTLKPEESLEGGLRVTPIQQAMELYESNFAGRVTDQTYQNMQYALDRIKDRITPEE